MGTANNDKASPVTPQPELGVQKRAGFYRTPMVEMRRARCPSLAAGFSVRSKPQRGAITYAFWFGKSGYRLKTQSIKEKQSWHQGKKSANIC
jgi:hypothetical protein